jgi:hypothetical protein
MDVEVGKSACSDPGSIPGVSTKFERIDDQFTYHYYNGRVTVHRNGSGQKAARPVRPGQTAHKGPGISARAVNYRVVLTLFGFVSKLRRYFSI